MTLPMERFQEEWQTYACSDCDPDNMDDEEIEEAKASDEYWPKLFMLAVPVGEPVPEHCPRCHSYLSLLDQDKVQLTNAWMRSHS